MGRTAPGNDEVLGRHGALKKPGLCAREDLSRGAREDAYPRRTRDDLNCAALKGMKER